ncbi:MAG: hypothetical protein Q4C47_04030, partial [Planctomycetia bacterium]|nr:hypothetical protein [Planctomycetia bacterium]
MRRNRWWSAMVTVAATIALMGSQKSEAIAQFCTIQAVNPRCEYRVNPEGIDVAAPLLSWEVVAAGSE